MPMPWPYRRATRDRTAFPGDAQERLGVPTDCPAGAVDFRAVHVDDPGELQRRIIWKGV